MPSASQPDPSAEGEVVEVFTGDSLEEAMAAAVAELGPALTVRRARKVRAGVRGLLGRDRYEVLAVPPPAGDAPPPQSDDAVGSALDALLEAADEQEAGGPDARPVSRPSADRPLSARPSSARLPEPPVAPRAGVPAPLPPAPRSGGPTARRGRTAGTAGVPGAPLAPVPDAAARPSTTAPAPAIAPLSDPLPDPLPEPPVRARRGRALGLPLADRTPHPDPRVSDHVDRAPSRRRRRTDLAAAPPAALPAAPPPAPPAALPAAPPAAPPPGGAVEEEPSLPPPSRGDGASVPRASRTRREEASPSPLRAVPAPSSGVPRTAGGWSRGGLSALGVPGTVLDALPSPSPRDDLGWVVALTAAIEATVPPPGEPDEQHPVVVSGFGLRGAVAVLDAGSRGLVPGTITHAGRTAPATATELALVLRHHVTGGG